MRSEYPAADNGNIAKDVLDAMTQAGVWKDDKQVVKLNVTTRYPHSEGITLKVV